MACTDNPALWTICRGSRGALSFLGPGCDQRLAWLTFTSSPARSLWENLRKKLLSAASSMDSTAALAVRSARPDGMIRCVRPAQTTPLLNWDTVAAGLGKARSSDLCKAAGDMVPPLLDVDRMALQADDAKTRYERYLNAPFARLRAAPV